MTQLKFATTTAQSAAEVWKWLPQNFTIVAFKTLGDEKCRSVYLIGGIEKGGWSMDTVLDGLGGIEVTDQDALDFIAETRR